MTSMHEMVSDTDKKIGLSMNKLTVSKPSVGLNLRTYSSICQPLCFLKWNGCGKRICSNFGSQNMQIIIINYSIAYPKLQNRRHCSQ